MEFDWTKVDPKIDDLLRKRRDLQREIAGVDDEIECFRQNCKHDFKFHARGPYEDTYKCEHCWEEVER